MSGAVRRYDPATAWAASRAAVTVVCGAAPPQTAGVLRGGVRSDRASAWRRKLAIYTAAISLDVGVKPLVGLVGVERRTLREIVAELEDQRDDPTVDGLLDLLKAAAERHADGGRLAA